MGNFRINRRHFLALSGAAGIGAAMSGGMSRAMAQGLSGTSQAILPSQAPSNWKAVLEKANAALQAEHGFTLDAQFINWSNYGQQALLKFTAGAQFDTALQALWLNMAQLQQDGALADLSGQLDKWPNLKAQIAPKLLESNTWNGKLWGIPQVNSAARVQHFTIRQDLAEKHSFGEISDYDTLERFFYTIKEKEDGITPYSLVSNSHWIYAVPTPTGMFNQHSWENPYTMQYLFAGSGLRFLFAKDAATTGSSGPIPFWEDEGVIAALRKIRQYYNDGIVNADGMNVDRATVDSQFQAGRFASNWAMTDGTASNQLVGLQRNIPEARLGQVMPFGKPLTAVKPVQTFQADNMVVVNANGGDVDRALALQDWLSVKENHDLIEYGIEGTDWEAAGEDGINQLSQYTFPGYALLWRSGLERRSSFMTESEKTVFDWAQNYDNFTTDTFASFIPDVTPVREAAAAMNNVIIQHANPLFYGVADVDSQLDKLKSAADAAGLDVLQAEMAKQADAYLKARA
jgi:putative aldouronate transport system substrate-binding protein